jgi:hypothetical protein
MFVDVAIVTLAPDSARHNSDLIALLKSQMRQSCANIAYNEYHQGVFYWLGTEGRTKPYKNPGLTNIVECLSTSTFSTTPEFKHTPSHFIDYALSYTYATNPNAYVTVSLEPSKMHLKPTHYSISSMIRQSWVFLRNWRFEGSDDGNTWKIIREHVNDDSIKNCGDNPSFKVECDKFYSHFRIYNVGPSSDSSADYLCFSKLELYGTLNKPPNFSFPVRDDKEVPTTVTDDISGLFS